MRMTLKARAKVLLLFLVLALITITYLPSLNNQFVNWDDNPHLLTNQCVRSLDTLNIKKIFTQFVNDTYIPLTTLSFAIEHHFFQYKPRIYHLTNLILHLLVVVLVYQLALCLALHPIAASIGALLFGVHPVHVESVAWVTGRKDLLYSIFYLLSVILYLKYLKGRGKTPPALKYLKKKRFLHYLGSVSCGVLSVLAKPMALSLPFVLWTMDWYKHRKLTKALFLDKGIYFFIFIPIAWVTYSRNINMFESNTSITQSIILYVWTFAFYIQKFFWPLWYCPIYEMAKPISITNFPYFFAFFEFCAIIGFVIYYRRNRLLSWSVIYYFTSIFFLLRINIASEVEMVTDRYMYLPSLGLCLCLGDWLQQALFKAKEGKRINQQVFLTVIITGIFLGLMVKSFMQCQIWKHGGSLWRYALKYYPNNAVVNNNLADYLLKKGQVNQEVVEYCLRAVESDPSYADAYVNLGSVLAQLGQVKEATQHFQKALTLKPNHAIAHANLAAALFQQRNWEESVIHSRRAIELGFQESGVYDLLEYSLRQSIKVR